MHLLVWHVGLTLLLFGALLGLIGVQACARVLRLRRARPVRVEPVRQPARTPARVS